MIEHMIKCSYKKTPHNKSLLQPQRLNMGNKKEVCIRSLYKRDSYKRNLYKKNSYKRYSYRKGRWQSGGHR